MWCTSYIIQLCHLPTINIIIYYVLNLILFNLEYPEDILNGNKKQVLRSTLKNVTHKQAKTSLESETHGIIISYA